MTMEVQDPDFSRPLDVVIAGAGLAGGSLALSMARSGARVALIDPAEFPRDKLCGEFLSPECWGVFDRLNLSGSVVECGYHQIHRVRLTTSRGRILESDFTSADGLPGIGLSRAALDGRLVCAARAAGVTVLEGVRVKGLIVRDGTVTGVVARRGAEEPFEISSTVIVAADGRHSPLVRQSGTTRSRSWFRPRLFGLKRHLTLSDRELVPAGSVGLHLVPGGYVGACRVEGELTNVCGLLPESYLKRHRGDLDGLANEVFSANPVLNDLWRIGHPVDAWKTVSSVCVEVSTPTLPGILYVGDAKGTIDPLGGQGMTMALLGAEMLAPFVTQALTRGKVDASLQRDYEAAWHRRFDRRIVLCRAFHHVLLNAWTIDIAAAFKTLAPRLLALGFNQTRDSLTA